MTKVYLISYATENFRKNQERLNESAKKYGIQNIISYTDTNLKNTKFYIKYKHILDNPKGGGYWLWCPFFIYKTLRNLNDGDILIYSDAGSIFVDTPIPLLKLCLKEQILLFTNNNLNIKYNKRECLIRMDCDSKRYIDYSAKQVPTGFQVYLNNEKTRSFVKEWLFFCCKPNLIEDKKSNFKEHEEFIEHKHHQAILTNLAIKNGIQLYRDPSQGGNRFKKPKHRKKGEWLEYPYTYSVGWKGYHYSNYSTIINHLRNTSKLKLLLIRIHTKLPLWLKKFTKKKWGSPLIKNG